MRWAAGLDPKVQDVFRFVTWFGQGGVTLVPSGLILIAAFALKPRLPQLASRLNRVIASCGLLFAAVAVAGLTNDAIKVIAGRARPRMWLNGEISGFFGGGFSSDYQSFPSGHTATTVAAAVVLSFLFPRGRIVFAIVALTIAVSRVIVNAHYVSDVLGGAAVGAVSAGVVIDWFRRKRWLPEPIRAA